MKIKSGFGFLMLLVLVLAGISCKSAAPVVEESPPAAELVPAPVAPAPPTGPSQTSLDALQKAAAKAEAARQRAVDFESPAYFPSEWESAEAQYTAAEGLPKGTDAETAAATAALEASADAFDGVFNRTIPLYAQAREDEVMAARDALVATGVTASFPEYLREVDESALLAVSQYEKGDYYAARDTAAAALERYQVMKVAADAWLARDALVATGVPASFPEYLQEVDDSGLLAVSQYEEGDYAAAKDTATDVLGRYQAMKVAADAWLARQEIVDNGFVERNSAGLADADDAGLAAVDAYFAGDIDSALRNAGEALRRYNGVLTVAWAAHAAELGEAARKARQAALDLKANVAVKDTFAEGEGFYTRAGAALRIGNYKDAAGFYTQSESIFLLAGQSAAEKRRLADEVLREAERRIEASDEAAWQAELLIQGGAI
ncbi:MAG: hypothetical protein LBD47_06175 [Treponema sp.]|jgi:hypothetical protein|nr:hypothetical protein [Treponema sp.]